MNGDAVETDLQRYYQIDMRTLGTPALTWRRFGALVRHLPTESATVRALGGPSFEWTATQYLLASILDVLMVANWQRSGRKQHRPKPLERPGQQTKKRYGRRRYTPVQLRERLAARVERARGEITETVT